MSRPGRPPLVYASRSAAAHGHKILLSDELVIITTRQKGASVLSLSGELDLASAPLLARALENEASGSAVVVIDLTGLDFMDSSGVHTLLDAQSRSQENGHQLVLRRGSPQVQRIFALTGTLQTFSFQD